MPESLNPTRTQSLTQSDDAFGNWMKEVDAILIRKAGLESDGCEDHCWRDLFDDGISPSDAADDALDCWGLLW